MRVGWQAMRRMHLYCESIGLRCSAKLRLGLNRRQVRRQLDHHLAHSRLGRECVLKYKYIYINFLTIYKTIIMTITPSFVVF